MKKGAGRIRPDNAVSIRRPIRPRDEVVAEIGRNMGVSSFDWQVALSKVKQPMFEEADEIELRLSRRMFQQFNRP